MESLFSQLNISESEKAEEINKLNSHGVSFDQLLRNQISVEDLVNIGFTPTRSQDILDRVQV